MKALEQAVAKERVQKEAVMKAQADAEKQDAIETVQQGVAEEKAKTEAELRALVAQKAWLQQQREREAAPAHEEVERRAAEAGAAAMQGAERKICYKTPTEGSRVDTLWTFFDGDPASRMKIDLNAEGFPSSEGSSPATRSRRKGKEKLPERPRRSAKRHMHDSDPFPTCSNGDGRNCRHRHKPGGFKVGVAGAGGGGGDDTPLSSCREGSPRPYRSKENTPGRTLRDPDPDGETWTPTTTCDWAQTPTHPAAEDPRMVDGLDPQAEDNPEDCREDDHLVDPRAKSHQAEDPREDHEDETTQTNRWERTSPMTPGHGSCTPRERSGAWSVRRRSTRLTSARVPPSPPKPRKSWTLPISRPGS